MTFEYVFILFILSIILPVFVCLFEILRRIWWKRITTYTSSPKRLACTIPFRNIKDPCFSYIPIQHGGFRIHSPRQVMPCVHLIHFHILFFVV